jgi:hypothetical protein
MARRNGHKGPTEVDTSKHPAVVEMQATLDEIGKQISLDDFLQTHVDRLRFEQGRNLAVQSALQECDLALFDLRSEETDIRDD